MARYDHIVIKKDKRFKPGTIQREGNVLRGHPDTMKFETLEMAGVLNPPIVISSALAKEVKRAMR